MVTSAQFISQFIKTQHVGIAWLGKALLFMKQFQFQLDLGGGEKLSSVGLETHQDKW